MKPNNNLQAFLELVKAGLWEKEACLLSFGSINFEEVYRYAQEQSVVGLVAAGLEHAKDIQFSKDEVLTIHLSKGKAIEIPDYSQYTMEEAKEASGIAQIF